MKFGDYCKIMQKRYGCEDELYTYKVIGTGRSNTYVDIPVKAPEEETIHDEVKDVVMAVCCGVEERYINKFKMADVLPIYDWEANYNPTI